MAASTEPPTNGGRRKWPHTIPSWSTQRVSERSRNWRASVSSGVSRAGAPPRELPAELPGRDPFGEVTQLLLGGRGRDPREDADLGERQAPRPERLGRAPGDRRAHDRRAPTPVRCTPRCPGRRRSSGRRSRPVSHPFARLIELGRQLHQALQGACPRHTHRHQFLARSTRPPDRRRCFRGPHSQCAIELRSASVRTGSDTGARSAPSGRAAATGGRRELRRQGRPCPG